jgi:2-polyprenyl-3-methyl-5-hydroxy-6-metoxy-1,4-benzoquinol methylase
MNNPELYFRRNRSEIVGLLPGSYSRILEIGCGEGNFYNYIKPECEYWGIEPNIEVSQVASNKLDNVLTGSFDEVYQDIPDNYFDLVICNDVIEHMPDHDAFLQDIKSKIRNHAYIVGSIPNVRHISNLIELLFEKDWKYREQGILDRTHLRFFTEKSLRRTFDENGYCIEVFEGINEVKQKRGLVKKLGNTLLINLFGKDTRFRQFGFRIKYLSDSDK